MAKRFTDTDKWKDDWFLSLPNDYRIVWQYCLDNCSHAGILKKNFKLLNFCCNTNLTEAKFNSIFSDRILCFERFFFIPKFLTFQYPKGLNSDKPAIVGVRNELKAQGMFLIVNQSLGNDYLTVKDKDKDKDTAPPPPEWHELKKKIKKIGEIK